MDYKVLVVLFMALVICCMISRYMVNKRKWLAKRYEDEIGRDTEQTISEMKERIKKLDKNKELLVDLSLEKIVQNKELIDTFLSSNQFEFRIDYNIDSETEEEIPEKIIVSTPKTQLIYDVQKKEFIKKNRQ